MDLEFKIFFSVLGASFATLFIVASVLTKGIVFGLGLLAFAIGCGIFKAIGHFTKDKY